MGKSWRLTPEDMPLKSLFGVGRDWAFGDQTLDRYDTMTERALGICDTSEPADQWLPLPRSMDYAMPQIRWGTIMGNDPAPSVVDADCRAHDHANHSRPGGGAVPSTAFAKITGADMQAVYAYWVSGVAPMDVPGGINALPFPFNIRASMIGRSRGAGLAEGAAHCATCHTARAILIRAMDGAQLGAWYAPNIASASEARIGRGSRDEIVADLATGCTEGKARGSMAEAVEHSFSRMTQDVQAVATYPHVFMPPFGT